MRRIPPPTAVTAKKEGEGEEAVGGRQKRRTD